MIQHTGVWSYKCTIETLELGVEFRSDVSCVQQPAIEKEGIGISHRVSNISKRKRLWTVISEGSDLWVYELRESSRGANENVIATDVRRTGQTITLIVNFYD